MNQALVIKHKMQNYEIIYESDYQLMDFMNLDEGLKQENIKKKGVKAD